MTKKVFTECAGCGALPIGDPRSPQHDPRERGKLRARRYCQACNAEHRKKGMRWCVACEKVLPQSDFGDNSARRNRKQSRCRACARDYAQVYRYGLTMEQCEALTAAQGYTCALCPRDFATHRACVDHDHTTGEVRGMLCVQCNSALGKLGDTVEGLRRAIAYLERPRPKIQPN